MDAFFGVSYATLINTFHYTINRATSAKLSQMYPYRLDCCINVININRSILID